MNLSNPKDTFVHITEFQAVGIEPVIGMVLEFEVAATRELAVREFSIRSWGTWGCPKKDPAPLLRHSQDSSGGTGPGHSRMAVNSLARLSTLGKSIVTI